jgi:hypothetical protein
MVPHNSLNRIKPPTKVCSAENLEIAGDLRIAAAAIIIISSPESISMNGNCTAMKRLCVRPFA